MKIILGTLFVSLAVIYFCTTLISVRNPRKSWWVSEFLVSSLHMPVIILLVFGGLFIAGSALYQWTAEGTKIWHVIASAVLFIAMIVGVKFMRIKARLTHFKSLATEGTQAESL